MNTGELTGLAWRSTLGLAHAHGAMLADPMLATPEEPTRLAATLGAAVSRLPRRSVSDWFDVMARVRAVGRILRPEDYRSTRESSLEELTVWIAESRRFVVEQRSPRTP